MSFNCRAVTCLLHSHSWRFVFSQPFSLSMSRFRFPLVFFASLAAGFLGMGCERKPVATSLPPSKPVAIIGSDTMVNLVQVLAETASKKHQGVIYEVSSGGSGNGFATLRHGSADIVMASRKITDEERTAIREARGKEPVEHHIGWNATAIWVNSANSIEEISLRDLFEIFADEGRYNDWSQVGASGRGAILPVIRGSCSGIHDGFREAVMKRTLLSKGYYDYRPMRSVIGSQEVVKFCAHTPEGIGYSSIGYSAPGAKNLKVSRASGEQAFAPTRENILAGSYPLISKLHFYTVGDPVGPLKQFIDFARSKEGRKVIEQSGMIAADSL